jgi:hypothetical protein
MRSKFARINNADLSLGRTRIGSLRFNFFDKVITFQNLAKYNVFTVQPWRLILEGDEAAREE